jgi:gluconolactonase
VTPTRLAAIDATRVRSTSPTRIRLPPGLRPEPELPDVVYRHDPCNGDTDVVADGFDKPNGLFDKPNGLAFSPDERVLYVGDSGEGTHRIEAFDALDGRRLFAVIDPG